MIEFRELEYRDFETLVGLLLQREGYQVVRGPSKPGTGGPDYEVKGPEDALILVDVKHFRLPLGRTEIGKFAGDIERYRQQSPAVQGLLVTSGQLSAAARTLIAETPHLEVWDRKQVEARLAKHHDLEDLLKLRIEAQELFQVQIEHLLKPARAESRSTKLAAALRAVPCGRGAWKDYERICTEILTHVFVPDLGAPAIQSRTDDGLDIRDAIFPIRAHHAPWSLVRSEYHTRFVVAEFKNYCEPIGQAQVESIAQYLFGRAHRLFGLLISRQAPSPSAIAQRRRKWLEEAKLIVFLEDEHLCEMLNLREVEADPFDIIDAQLEDFLRTLTP